MPRKKVDMFEIGKNGVPNHNIMNNELDDEISAAHGNKKILREIIAKSISLANQLETRAVEKKNPRLYEGAAISYSYAAFCSEKLNDYMRAWKFRKSSAQMYNNALNNSPPESTGNGLECIPWNNTYARYREMQMVSARKDRRNAALYRATDNMNPILRSLVRRSKIIHSIFLLFLALIFSTIGITGNTISFKPNLSINNLGVLFFILFLFIFSLAVYKIRLTNI